MNNREMAERIVNHINSQFPKAWSIHDSEKRQKNIKVIEEIVESHGPAEALRNIAISGMEASGPSFLEKLLEDFPEYDGEIMNDPRIQSIYVIR